MRNRILNARCTKSLDEKLRIVEQHMRIERSEIIRMGTEQFCDDAITRMRIKRIFIKEEIKNVDKKN